MEKTTQNIEKKYKLKLGRVFKTIENTNYFVFQLEGEGKLICSSIEILSNEPFMIGHPNVWQVSEVSPEGKQIDGRLFVWDQPEFGYSWFDVQNIIYLSVKQQLFFYGNTI